MNPEIEKLILRAPERYRKHYRSILCGKSTRAMSIKYKCLECCGWERHESGVDKVGDCTVRGCPLWACRPYQAIPLKVSRARPGSNPRARTTPRREVQT